MPFFRPALIFPVPDAWFPVRLSRFCLFSSPVCFRSLLPASLPQPFHRCSGILRLLQLPFPTRPCVRSLSAFLSVRVSLPLPFVSSGSLPFCFHPASFPQQFFRFAPVRLGLCYLVSVSSFPCFKLPPHSGFHSAVPFSVPLFRFPSSVPPAPSCLRFLWLSGSAPHFLPPLGFSPWFVSLLRSAFRRPLSVSLVRFPPDSVLGSPALLFAASDPRLTVASTCACLPSRVQTFPLASFFPFVSSGSAFPRFRLRGFPLRFPPRPP